MEDRANGQIEKPLPLVKGPLSHLAEKGMALFSQVVEEGLSLIVDPVPNIQEPESIFLVFLEIA